MEVDMFTIIQNCLYKDGRLNKHFFMIILDYGSEGYIGPVEIFNIETIIEICRCMKSRILDYCNEGDNLEEINKAISTLEKL